MREESQKVALAFINKLPAKGRLSHSNGTSLVLHVHSIVQHVTYEGKRCYAFCLHGYPTKTTLDRMNAVTLIAFGVEMFRLRKGEVFFGHGLLREMDLEESICIPVDFKPGDHHVARARNPHRHQAPTDKSDSRVDGAGDIF